jgi:hypothetical protein
MRKALLAVVFLMAGCSSIKQYENLDQQTNTGLRTFTGGEVFKLERSSDLPNVIGKADVWGGKVDRGYLQLRYLGVQPNGYLGFAVIDAQTNSNETTMSRYGVTTSTINTQSNTTGTSNGYMTGNQLYSSGNYQTNTTGTVTTFNAPEGHTLYLPPNATTFVIPPSQRQLQFGSVGVMIQAYDNASLTYVLTRI